MKSERELQRLATRLLESMGISSPPIDVAAVARRLGAKIRLEKADLDLSGALYRIPGRTVIGVNKDHPPVRRRFTIAHEIGHLILHDQPVFIDRFFPIGSMSPGEPKFRRNSLSSQAVDIKEIEANRFAAALLMPESLLAPDVKKYKSPLTSISVQTLAKRYQVSTQAMMFRLVNLGIPVEQA